MNSFTRLALVFLSAITIIIADAMIKRISAGRSIVAVMTDPLMAAICGLYLIQIVFAILIFIFEGELAIYTNLFIVFYGLSGLAVGYFLFHETVTFAQGAGILLGIAGAVLMSL
ncbi:MAG: hypothetical protein HGA38_02275 [Candidatus Moranbacteria bacterium]|nr:hypothetical protein [Candidatus Moranbacteria bacterium]